MFTVYFDSRRVLHHSNHTGKDSVETDRACFTPVFIYFVTSTKEMSKRHNVTISRVKCNLYAEKSLGWRVVILY